MQEVSSSPSSATVVGIDQNGTMIQLPVEAFTRAGQTGKTSITSTTACISHQSIAVSDSVYMICTC